MGRVQAIKTVGTVHRHPLAPSGLVHQRFSLEHGLQCPAFLLLGDWRFRALTQVLHLSRFTVCDSVFLVLYWFYLTDLSS